MFDLEDARQSVAFGPSSGSVANEVTTLIIRPCSALAVVLLTTLAACAGRSANKGASTERDAGALPDADVIVTCPSESCPAGQECCLRTGQCFDPTTDACPVPSALPDAGEPSVFTPCAADSQCGANEVCGTRDVSSCVSVGICQARTSCESCEPQGAPECQVCGCNGTTYASALAACADGARIASHRACGLVDPQQGASMSSDHPPPAIIGCARPGQCPSGQDCCRITGTCYDPSCPGCCQIPPAGTRFPCETDAQCFADFEFCDGPGCGGPGGCREVPSAGCTGTLNEVCGCDGKTYVNGCWAQAARVRIDKQGRCQ
jgi:hypothetical protein